MYIDYTTGEGGRSILHEDGQTKIHAICPSAR